MFVADQTIECNRVLTWSFPSTCLCGSSCVLCNVMFQRMDARAQSAAAALCLVSQPPAVRYSSHALIKCILCPPSSHSHACVAATIYAGAVGSAAMPDLHPVPPHLFLVYFPCAHLCLHVVVQLARTRNSYVSPNKMECSVQQITAAFASWPRRWRLAQKLPGSWPPCRLSWRASARHELQRRAVTGLCAATLSACCRCADAGQQSC